MAPLHDVLGARLATCRCDWASGLSSKLKEKQDTVWLETGAEKSGAEMYLTFLMKTNRYATGEEVLDNGLEQNRLFPKLDEAGEEWCFQNQRVGGPIF